MLIAYIDLSLNIRESYTNYNPTRYGGGAIFARICKQFNNFRVIAKSECFDDLTEKDNKQNCKTISQDQINELLNNAPIEKIIPEILGFDIICHCTPQIFINTDNIKIIQTPWSVGYSEQIHPKHKHLLLYNDFQDPQISNKEIKIHKFILGKQLPEFQEYKKENYLFQCSRLHSDFAAIEVASFCLQNKIKGIFAGPIYPNYPFLDYIDNQNTFYLGQIPEEQKIELTKHARLYTLLANWPLCESLSMKEALMFGTPVVTTWTPFTQTIIKNGINGFFSFNEENLLNAWNKAPEISQFECWRSVLKYNHYNMVDSLYDCFNNILYEI